MAATCSAPRSATCSLGSPSSSSLLFLGLAVALVYASRSDAGPADSGEPQIEVADPGASDGPNLPELPETNNNVTPDNDGGFVIEGGEDGTTVNIGLDGSISVTPNENKPAE